MTIVVVRRQKSIIMEGSASSINSRATAIKTILLAAWREKLSQEEWANRIKKVLPRGVNGDVYDLADCLLKQALVGPVPSRLFIDYLKYAVRYELVSHGAVLSSIANQPIDIRLSNLAPSRTSPIVCLVEFLKSFRDKISCTGTEIECLNLCNSLGQLIYWLLKCIQLSTDCLLESLSQLHQTLILQNQQSQLQTNLMPASSFIFPTSQQESLLGTIDLCLETILYFIDKPFAKSLLFISKIEYSRNFNGISESIQSIQQKLATCPNVRAIQDKLQYFRALRQLHMTFNSHDMHPSVVAAQQLRSIQMHRIRSAQVSTNCNFERKFQQQPLIHDSSTNYALFNSLYPLIAFDVVLRPARPHKKLAHQIATITNCNSAPVYMTYCELIRVCMIGLIDTNGTPAKIKWAFFTFLKMPKLLLELSNLFNNNNNNNNLKSLTTIMNSSHTSSEFNNSTTTATLTYVSTFINDLKLAFERLCQYSPLLDEAESKCSCDLFKCIVKELIRNDPNLIQLKNVDLRKFPSRGSAPPNNDNLTGGHLVLKTEAIVSKFLDNLDSTHDDPSELFALLGQLVAGKQFEFTLSAAASTGRLNLYVEKLVEHNESFNTSQTDTATSTTKHPQIQALIFDMTFLILTYIAHQYGPEMIESSRQSSFKSWYCNSYNPSTRINCPKEILKNSDDNVVSSLIKQLLHPNENIQMKSSNWSSTCNNIPKALSEILIAWDQGHLSDQQINTVIERIKSRMCSLAVVAATWLHCHIRTLSENDKSKPLSFLQCLTKASHQAKQQKQGATTESGLKSDNYSERSSLMCSIIRRIYFDIVPAKSTNSSGQTNPSTNSSSTTNSNAASAKTNNTAHNVATCGDPPSSEESQGESAVKSINDKFISTATTQEIFLANVKQCLSRGFIDHKSLISLSSLFRMIGSQCYTNLLVEQILTSHESPSDLSRAVDITFGLFHLDIDACAFALLSETIPTWLMSEKKQVLLNQPRAFALAHLAVMTVIEVFNNIQLNNDGKSMTRTEGSKKLLNGVVKQEPGLSVNDQQLASNTNGPRGAKRIKLTQEPILTEKEAPSRDAMERLDRLNNCVADLMRLFKEIMSDPVMSHRSLFPILFLQQTVICTREKSSAITVHLQPEILLDIIKLFSSELTFELVLAISNLSTTNSRKFAAKAMCKLAQVQEAKQHNRSSHGFGELGKSTPSIEQTDSSGGSKSMGGASAPTPMILG